MPHGHRVQWGRRPIAGLEAQAANLAGYSTLGRPRSHGVSVGHRSWGAKGRVQSSEARTVSAIESRTPCWALPTMPADGRGPRQHKVAAHDQDLQDPPIHCPFPVAEALHARTGLLALWIGIQDAAKLPFGTGRKWPGLPVHGRARKLTLIARNASSASPKCVCRSGADGSLAVRRAICWPSTGRTRWGSDFGLLRDFQGVIHLDAKVAHSGFKFGMAEE